ncbi:AAHS family benzoate transporter-like MFS transporter [Ureibacillus xyleni]|uniref:AAHS family benzoate transporter-like MFS transporter n=1 Tax=Ureibacillus xyleni TaxID=614648 RepID=A0A285SY55_9BACL|nr:aromatic acid/H+ symport family MFS transporter [Ureibacillus xyleni]SOC13313.1 AAHS family benzoate transporter-like MFS transporter [Ureibacillus xyleni]
MNRINVANIIAESKFNRFHFGLLAWCFFIILFDGYDLVVYGTAVPLLMEEWGLNTVEAGAIGSYGLFGMMFGAMIFGVLADRLGRKNVTAISLILFSLFTLLCGFATSATMFSIFRFIAGLGLGGIMPNVIALLTDYSPKKMRSMVVSIVLCGYSVGGMLAPILGIFVMPSLGWESIFWFAGVPLLFLPLMYKKLPESAVFLVRKGRKEELFKNLQKVNPNLSFNGNEEIETIQEDVSKVPVVGLFKEKRALSTLMFWIAFFSCLLMVYGLNTWLPKLMIEAGYGLNSSLGFLVTLQGGAIVGTIIIGRLCDKYGSKKMLVPMYASGAIALTLLGLGGNTFYIYVLVAIAGAATIGAQNIVQAYVSQYYPPYIRSTALGMASGIGRMGGMMGPILGGFLLSISLPIEMNFIVFAIPGVLASIALVIVGEKHSYIKSYNEQSIEKIKNKDTKLTEIIE